MKSRTISLLAGLYSAALLTVSGQWVTTGNPITLTTSYLGCDNTSTQPLRLKTILNDPIYFYTGDINRMRLMDTITTGVINGYQVSI